MSLLTLKGDNLGQKHSYFNCRVNEAVKSDASLSEIMSQYGDSDAEQLFKIEVANRRRDVEYVVQTLKSADMVVVSRAIRGSGWLVVDEQYSHIVEPHFLHDQLLPHMTTRAACKFMLHVRLTLKDERRVESFFKYYEDKDLDKALKWLPGCSAEVIQEAVVKHQRSINVSLFKRLYRKASSAFNNVSDPCNNYIKDAAIFLLKTDTEKYMTVLEKTEQYNWTKLGRKQTAIIMKYDPERILNNFKQYKNKVDFETVAKYLEPKEVLIFMTNLKNTASWTGLYNRMYPFVKRLPIEQRYEFIKDNFIINNKYTDDVFNTLKYEWYRLVPFNDVFNELSSLIKTMPSPEQRGLMRTRMLIAAAHNMTNIQTILQYYQDKHMNESFHLKKRFVDAIVLHTNTHRYDEKTWKMLDELFHSLEVYMESDKDVQNIIHAIIIYKIVHDQPIPEIVERKFNFTTLKKYKSAKLTQKEKDNIFQYLFTSVMSTLNSQPSNEQQFSELIPWLSIAMDLLIDWDKDLAKYPSVLSKIKELFRTINQTQNKEIMKNIYNKKKSWRKYMFEESLLCSMADKTYVNALKHDPTILNRYPAIVKAVRCDDAINLRQFLSKLKIYWSDTLADKWINAYKNNMKSPTGCRALVTGLCALLPNQELLNVLEYYAPDSQKIIWSEADVTLLNIRKNFARLMHLANPHPPPSAAIRYARGDYRQFALPSLNSILYNIPPHNTYDQLSKILSGPVSLQKHAIRMVFVKLQPHEIKNIFSDVWESSKSATIRSVIFRLTFKLLCSHKSEAIIDELWQLLEVFIGNLSCEENAQIYTFLTKVEQVPLSIRAKFCIKSFMFFKKSPSNLNYNSQQCMEKIMRSTTALIENIDSNFISNVILDYIENRFTKQVLERDMDRTMVDVITYYMLCTKLEEEQSRRYELVMKPLLDCTCFSFNMNCEQDRRTRTFCDTYVRRLLKQVKDHIHENKYVIPIKLLTDIQRKLESVLSYEENYEFLTLIKLVIKYIETCKEIIPKLKFSNDVNKGKDNDERYEVIWMNITPILAEYYIQLLKEDMEKLFPFIRILLTKVLMNFHGFYQHRYSTNFVIVRELIKNYDFVPGIILAMEFVPTYCRQEDEKEELRDIFTLIVNHPSKEVRLYYFNKFRDNSSIIYK